MAEQIHRKHFIATRLYSLGENENDVRDKVLKELNEFLFKHDGVDVVNIVEDWFLGRGKLQLTVYYKDYI